MKPDQIIHKAREYTAHLPQAEEQFLFVQVPLVMDADSTDMEYFLALIWKRPVKDVEAVARSFGNWYRPSPI